MERDFSVAALSVLSIASISGACPCQRSGSVEAATVAVGAAVAVARAEAGGGGASHASTSACEIVRDYPRFAFADLTSAILS